MIVVGGTYREYCNSPRFSGIFGPGLRAALTLSRSSLSVQLHTFAPRSLRDDVLATCDAFGVEAHITAVDEAQTGPIRFDYLNALRPRPPCVSPETRRTNSIEVSGKNVLLLGLIEGTASVKAAGCVFEPEEESDREAFASGRCRADRLAVVMRAGDFRSELGIGQNPIDLAASIRRSAHAEVLVVRSELGSATVFHGDRSPEVVHACETRSWHRVGLGNVFSAVFARHWLELGEGPANAARAACLAAARYNEIGTAPFSMSGLPPLEEAPWLHVPLAPSGPLPVVRLEGCNDRYVERNLFEDAFDGLGYLQMQVQTRIRWYDTDPWPTWDDGFEAMLVLADFADERVLQHAAAAIRAGKPVVSYGQYPATITQQLTRRPEVEAVDDLATALYRTAVAVRRRTASSPP